MSKIGFTKVAVSGFLSDSGKTSLICALLPLLPGWEAIKMTRGHYRSCGKDPHACCVSDMLGEQPVIRSGRGETYTSGKDTGRYWDAGASNVHWVIVTDDQVDAGIDLALERVRAPGVLIEGTSFLRGRPVDHRIMVARPTGGKIKTSARVALPDTDSLYLFDETEEAASIREAFSVWATESRYRNDLLRLPIFTRADLPQLAALIRSVAEARAA